MHAGYYTVAGYDEVAADQRGNWYMVAQEWDYWGLYLGCMVLYMWHVVPGWSFL